MLYDILNNETRKPYSNRIRNLPYGLFVRPRPFVFIGESIEPRDFHGRERSEHPSPFITDKDSGIIFCVVSGDIRDYMVFPRVDDDRRYALGQAFHPIDGICG